MTQSVPHRFISESDFLAELVKVITYRARSLDEEIHANDETASVAKASTNLDMKSGNQDLRIGCKVKERRFVHLD
jgi:hypothetical protein